MSEENQVVSETVSEQPTQDTSQVSSDDKYIAESKKYRKRAQDAEAKIAELEKRFARQEEEQLKKKEDFKALYEKVSTENESLSTLADKWKSYEENKRSSLLEKHPEQERDYLSKLDLETLEYVTSKINNSKPNPPEVIGRSKDVIPNKPWKDMNESERKAYYDSKVGITKGNR
tara:strand:+ start:5077 stop:5598 length:522 start_codon:yes stop_codon:yes gene_type:complete